MKFDLNFRINFDKSGTQFQRKRPPAPASSADVPGAESDANAIRAAAVETFLIQNYLTEKVELKPELAGRHDTDLVNVVLREMLKHHAHVEVVLHRGPIQPHVQFSAQCFSLGPEKYCYYFTCLKI